MTAWASLVVGLALVGGLCLALGYAWAAGHLHDEAATLDDERAALDAGWAALERAARVRAVFLDTHRALRRAADEAARGQSDEQP